MTTIPGVETIHERSAWEPIGYRMGLDFTRVPPLLNPYSVDEDALHYTADDDLPDGDFGEFIQQLPAYLAAITINYLRTRSDGGYVRRSDGFYFPGYPIGYNFAVDWLGGVWVLRGWDFVPAATNGHNGHTIAILLLTDLADPGSDLMWRSIRCIRREAVRRKMKLPNRPLGHGEFRTKYGVGTPTACPGHRILRQRDQGLGDLNYPDTQHREIDMVIIDFNAVNSAPWVRLRLSDSLEWVQGGASAVLERSGLPKVAVSRGELIDAMRSFGTSGPSPWDQAQPSHAPTDDELSRFWSLYQR